MKPDHLLCSDTADFLRASEGLLKQPNLSGELQQPSLSKITPTRSQSYERTSPVFPSTEISETSTLDEASSTSSQVEVPAKTSAVLEKEKELMESDRNSGLKCSESLSSASPGLLSGKTLKERCIAELDKWLPASEWSDITARTRSSYRQRRSELCTKDLEFLSCPTLTSGDRSSGRPAGVTKCEQWFKDVGLIPPGYQLSAPAIAKLMGFPADWFHPISECPPELRGELGLGSWVVEVSAQHKQRSLLAVSSTSTALSKTMPRSKEPQDFLRKNSQESNGSIFPKKKEPEDFLRKNSQGSNGSIFPKKKGRGKNRMPASGYLAPVVQQKRDKQGRIVEYPRVEGERVHHTAAFDYPHQFFWIYNWSICDADGCWKTKSKSVPRNRIWSVRSAIATNKPVEQILKLIEKP